MVAHEISQGARKIFHILNAFPAPPVRLNLSAGSMPKNR
jgi:hypothetical protein